MTDKPTDRNATSGEPGFLEAAKRRKKMPLWAIPIFPALLVWAIIYVNGVTKPVSTAQTPDTMGAALYATCAGCHGATGGGIGLAPKFAGGDLLKTFSKWQDQVKWVNVGTQNWKSVTGETTFGDTKKPLNGVMPGFGPLGADKSFTCSQILLVVRYEREHFAKAAPDKDLNALADQIAAGVTPSAIPNCTS